MSTFKDLVESDISTFINLDEFASEHDVNGNIINVVLEDEEITDKDDTQAVSDSAMVLYGKTEELGSRRMRGETFYVDDVGYTVNTWLDEMGITKITLTIPESW